MTQLIPPQTISLRVPNPVITPILGVNCSPDFQFSSQWGGWQFCTPGAWVNFSLTLPEAQAVKISFVMCCMAVDGQTNNPLTLRVNNSSILFTGFDPHRQSFETFTFYLPAHWLVAGLNNIALSLDGNATTRATMWSFDAVGIETQTTQSTAISFQTPSPQPTDMMSITGNQSCEFDSRFNAWSITAVGGSMSFGLFLDQPRLIAVTMNFCSMLNDGATNNPFTITVNGNVLVANYDPHNCDFHNEQWLVPANWVVADSNSVVLTLSGGTTTLDFKSFGAAAQVLPAQTVAITLRQSFGYVEVTWPAMIGATSYEIAAYKGVERTKPYYSDTHFLGEGVVLPGEAVAGDYTVRLRPWTDNVAGTWTDFTTVTVSRIIVFLSASGQQNANAARLVLEDLGIVIFDDDDGQHFEGLADSVQVAAAQANAYVHAVYTGALTQDQINSLPAAQQAIALDWNYYYSAAYQQVLADTSHNGLCWGDELMNGPPVGLTVDPQHLTALIPGGAAPTSTLTEAPLSLADQAALRKRLAGYLGDGGAADRMVHAMAVLPEATREQLFATDLQPHLLALANLNPNVAMRGAYGVGIVVVQSSKEVGGTPTGWTVKTQVASGAKVIAVTGGTNDFRYGDTFTINEIAFLVTAWDPMAQTVSVSPDIPSVIEADAALVTTCATRKGPRFTAADQAIVIQRAKDALQSLQGMAPEFRPANWDVAVNGPAGATSVRISGGVTFPRPGDSFTLPGAATTFSVTAFDIASSTIQCSPALPAVSANQRLTFPDTQNLRLIPQVFTVEVDVGYEYNPTVGDANGAGYWVLPAVAKVSVDGVTYPATWDGLESLRQALQTRTGAQGASLVFLSAFPTGWFGFAQAERGLVVMAANYKSFSKAFDAAVAGQLNARDVAAVRTWLNSGPVGHQLTVPATAPMVITVENAGSRWQVATQVSDTVSGDEMDRTFLVVAAGGTPATTLTVSQADGWGLHNWNRVIGHEMLHLFGAPDEYSGEGTACSSCGGSYGVYNIPNGNCKNCADPAHVCLMDSNDFKLCDYTITTIGWSDVLVEVHTDPASANNNDPMWIKLGDGLTFRLSDPEIDDRRPNARDPYGLGYTRLTKADIQTIAVGNDTPNQITTPWKIKGIRVWVQGELIYNRDDLTGTVDADHPWFIAPGFTGNISGYEVTVTTGTKWFAGTGDNVYLTLGGKKVMLNEFVLIDDPPYGGYSGFPDGSVKTSVIAPVGIDIRANPTITLTKEYSSLLIEPLFGGDDWYPAHIKIVAHRLSGGDVVVLDSDINTWIGMGNYSWSIQAQNVP
jgi:hypothetical protein